MAFIAKRIFKIAFPHMIFTVREIFSDFNKIFQVIFLRALFIKHKLQVIFLNAAFHTEKSDFLKYRFKDIKKHLDAGNFSVSVS